MLRDMMFAGKRHFRELQHCDEGGDPMARREVTGIAVPPGAKPEVIGS